MNNRSVLKQGYKLRLESENGDSSFFEVDLCIGCGGNSIVYEVHQGETEIGRLKEFYPDIPGIYRDPDENIAIDKLETESGKQDFSLRKKEFEALTEKRMELRNINTNISATMPEYCQLLRGKNTLYFFQSYTNGQCYANIHSETMEDVIHTAISLVNAVKCYHDAGYVHLDLKPENMLVNWQGKKNVRVQLFDYETVTRFDFAA